jgi:hypothetical protein
MQRIIYCVDSLLSAVCLRHYTMDQNYSLQHHIKLLTVIQNEAVLPSTRQYRENSENYKYIVVYVCPHVLEARLVVTCSFVSIIILYILLCVCASACMSVYVCEHARGLPTK